MQPLISVITPSLNAARYLDGAIQSVLAQQYENFEHIVVDAGSRDGTVEILQRYPHLRWSSEPDRGQSDAMNKGFARARGDVIVYLNADDYFEPNAFAAVLPALSAGAKFVVGRVRIIGPDGPREINDPKVTMGEMLRWWLPDAFPYNPLGYFYLREVQESVGPFNCDDHFHMDYEFLIEAARRYPLKRIHDILGTLRYLPGTKSFDNHLNEIVTFRRFRKFSAYIGEPEGRLYLDEWDRFEERIRAKMRQNPQPR